MFKEIRVLQILNRLNIGGVSIIVVNLCHSAPAHARVSLLSGQAQDSEGDATFMATNLGIEPVLIPEMQRNIDFKNDKLAYETIRQYIKKFKPHVVHTHAAKAGALGRLAAYHENVPVIVHTFHGHVFEGYFGALKSKMYVLIERYLAQKTTKIIALSALQKNDLVEKYKIASANRFEVIANGFDLSVFQHNIPQKRLNFRTQWNIAQNQVVIGIIGRLAAIKNIGFFLQAVSLLEQSTQEDFKVFIIGDGEQRAQLEVQTQALNLSNRVVFTSWIDPIDEAYAGIDILALSSTNEGTPTTLIEAQAAAKPIVATQVGGVADTVLPQKSAFLIKSGDVNQFANALKKLVESPTMQQQMGEAGRKFAFQHFGMQHMIEKTYNLYQQLLNAPQKY